MRHPYVSFASLAAITCIASAAHAVSSAELFTAKAYTYGRFEARIQFAAGDGIVSSFFLWKDRSEIADVFWNELDFEKVDANCRLLTNALYGLPEGSQSKPYVSEDDWCGTFHTYTYEWTPDYIAWFIDGQEIRRDTGGTADAFRDNAAGGMQIRFNIWPGDRTFGGNFDPAILPVHQYVNWVQYSAYVDGAFEFEWREDFSGNTVPSGWRTANWGSPKNLSTHAPGNVNFINGYAVLSLTADDAKGPTGAMPLDPDNVEPEPPPPPEPTAPVLPPTTPDPSAPTAAADADGDAGGCSVHSPARSSRSRSTWLVLGLGLVLGGLRRAWARPGYSMRLS